VEKARTTEFGSSLQRRSLRRAVKERAPEDRKEQTEEQLLFTTSTQRFQVGNCAAKGSSIGNKYRRVVGAQNEKVGL